MTDSEQPRTDADGRQSDAPPEGVGTSRLAPMVLGGLLLLAGLMGGVNLLLIIAGIVVMIFLHELGHYIAAKRARMKVTEFFLGFGPRIWSFTRGETEYGLKAIPAGAYVRIIGMSNLEEVPEEDEPRTYRVKSFPQRLAVAVAGSTMHFVQAIVMLFVLYALVGLPGGGTLHDPPRERWQIDEIVEDSAAANSDLRTGDQIVAIDGMPVDSFNELANEVSQRPGERVGFSVLRDGSEVTVEMVIGTNPDAPERGFLGVGAERPPVSRETVRSPVAAVGDSVETFGFLMKESVLGIGRIFSPSGLSDYAGQVATGGSTENRAPSSGEDRPAGGSGSEEPSGENRFVSLLGIGQIGTALFGSEGVAVGFLLLFAQINIFIGVINLAPLLPLDGGHVVIAVYERIRSRGGRRHFADLRPLIPITYGVVAVLIFIGLSSIYLDLVNPLV